MDRHVKAPLQLLRFKMKHLPKKPKKVKKSCQMKRLLTICPQKNIIFRLVGTNVSSCLEICYLPSKCPTCSAIIYRQVHEIRSFTSFNISRDDACKLYICTQCAKCSAERIVHFIEIDRIREKNGRLEEVQKPDAPVKNGRMEEQKEWKDWMNVLLAYGYSLTHICNVCE